MISSDQPSASRKSRHSVTPDLRWPFSLAAPRKALLRWYQEHKRALPWRTKWTSSADPYVVWISEIMLQQTVIKAVIPVYDRFLTAFPSLQAFAAADEAAVREAVRGLGYYRRFGFMHAAARQLVAAGGEWPQDFAGWRALPGVGDYTAAAVSSIAFNVPAAVVDGNVERVFCRLLDLRQAPNDPKLKPAFKRLAAEFVDHEYPGDFNQAVMELGQTVCTVSQPACSVCPLKRQCLARARSSQDLAPGPKIKIGAPIDVRIQLVVFSRQSLIGIVKRPDEAKFLRGTDGFLTMLAPEGVAPEGDGWLHQKGLNANFSANLAQFTQLGTFRHSITKHRITAEVLLSEFIPAQLDLVWLHVDEVERQLLANLDRKAWLLARPKIAQSASFKPASSRKPAKKARH